MANLLLNTMFHFDLIFNALFTLAQHVSAYVDGVVLVTEEQIRYFLFVINFDHLQISWTSPR